jgi:hypothetical protein
MKCALGGVLAVSSAAVAADDGGKSLIFNLPAMDGAQVRKLLDLVPILTLGGALINAGSASHPVLCFSYDEDGQAKDVLAQLADVYGAKDVAKSAQIFKSCGDYGD